MTVTIDLSPEREAVLRAQAQARGLSIEEWLLRLAEQAGSVSGDAQEQERPVWEVLADSMRDVPAEDLAALPRDGASQIDHYVYGLPKSEE